MAETCWTLLQIAPTQDENDIRRAYARRLRDFRPDEDPEGFQRLVGAKEAALDWAKSAELPALTVDDGDDRGIDADLALLTSTYTADNSSEQQTIDAALLPELSAEDDKAIPDAGDNAETEKESTSAAVFHAYAGPIEDERDRQIFERLNEIVAPDKQRPWSAGPVARKTESWSQLFDMAASLSLQRHEQFLKEIGRHLPPILPGKELQALETLEEFTQGHGFATVVEMVEQHCRFAERPELLVRLCGQDAAMMYFSWVAHAQSARGILQRRKTGRGAYADAQTGLPVFPPEDRIFALQTVELVKFHKEAVERRRWPRRFDWKTLIFPITRSAAAGLTREGALFLVILGLIVAGGLSTSNDIAQMIGLACIPILLIARIVMAFFINRLAVGASLRRVMRADRRGLWSKPRPNALRNHWHDYVQGIFVGELILSMAALILAPIMIATFLQLKDDLDRPAETVVSELVFSALDAVANDDRLPDSALFDVIDFVNSAELLNFHDRSKGTSITVRDLENREWLAELHRRVDRLLGTSLLSGSDRDLVGPILATPAAERELKLHVLADAYRSATPERRMEIQRVLARWKPTLDAANGPQAVAAVWAAIPPRRKGPNLDAFSEEMRRLLLDRFLASAVGVFSVDEIQLVTRFHDLLTVPADGFAAIGPIGSPDANSMVSISGPSPADSDAVQGKDLGVARYLEEHPDRLTGAAARMPGLSRTSSAMARSSFFDIARICLDSNSDADRVHMRESIGRSLENFPDARISTTTNLWQTLGRIALAEPNCYRKAFIAGRVYSGDIRMGQLDEQFDALEEELDQFSKTDGGISNPDVLADFVQFIPQDGIYSFTRNKLTSEIHFLLGKWLAHKEDYHKAILEFDQALDAKECNEFYVHRLQALRAIGDNKRAQADLQQAFQKTGWCMIDGGAAQALLSSLKTPEKGGH
ncbi:hypothetical protein [Rhizobium sp. BT03]|uniref:hypothetical protein n=1 Tax=Rhizobium sp. BT03 TaxID=3045156 RepID=UPI0024B3CC2D|nr:hypothetical protein [Rhizobium sp. BT03]WHO71133.1 hypothetical protein QMO80_000120 [Rhizobium sp. BT03]